jgi:hypothetical protein
LVKVLRNTPDIFRIDAHAVMLLIISFDIGNRSFAIEKLHHRKYFRGQKNLVFGVTIWVL